MSSEINFLKRKCERYHQEVEDKLDQISSLETKLSEATMLISKLEEVFDNYLIKDLSKESSWVWTGPPDAFDDIIAFLSKFKAKLESKR